MARGKHHVGVATGNDFRRSGPGYPEYPHHYQHPKVVGDDKISPVTNDVGVSGSWFSGPACSARPQDQRSTGE